MKFRKVVSLFAAAALAVSSFAGLGISASAAESEIVVYSLDRTDYDYTVLSGGTDGVDAGTTVNGLGYIGALSADSSGASYTYTDVNGSETTYNFTKSWKGGQGSTSRRCLYFTPKSACKVTAVFKGSAEARNMTIYQSSDATITQPGTGSVVGFSLDITDTTKPVYVYGGSSNKNLYAVIVEYYGTDSGETPEETEAPADTEVNIEAVINKAGLLTSDELTQGTAVNFGIDASGNRVEADSIGAVMVISGNYHSDHGLTNLVATVPVSGPAKITVGSCTFGNSDATVTDLAGNTITVKGTGACWKNNTENAGVAYYAGEATTLTIKGGSYVPYVAVEEIDASEIPNDATVTYSVGSSGAEGIAPAGETVQVGKTVTIPKNTSLYVEGSTLTGWTDGTATYAIGETVTLTADTTLTPVFTANTVALGDAASSVEFTLRRDSGAITYASQGGSTIIVGQASINGTSIDVKTDVDTTNGKLANASWTDWAQVIPGTIFTVPVIEGSVVTMGDLFGDDGTYTIGGEALVGDSGTYTATEAGTVDIVVGDPSGSYWRGFSVTYPQVATEEPEATTAPSTEAVTLKFPYTSINNGNVCTDSATYLFVDGVDSDIASFFADSSDSTKVDSTLTAGYKNYIVGTNEGYDSPYITADLPAGTYKVYFLGYNHGKEVNATIASTGETVYDTTGGVQFAYQSDDASRILKLYTLEFTLSTAVTGETITFDSTQDSWLPDLYAIVLTNQSAAPEATPTPIPDATDVMPDFAYQFANTNSTELTSTSSGTYYLDKDGKLCDSASYQTVTLTNVRYHNSHGLYSNSGATYKFRAQAPFKVTVGTCTFDDGSGKLLVKDLDGNTLYESDTVTFNDACYISSSDNVVEFAYTGTGVVDVTFSTPSGCYFPYLAKTSIDTDTISGALTGADGLNEGTLTFTSQTTGNVYTGTISNGTYSVVVPTGDTYDVLLTDCGYVAVTTYTANGDNSSADITCSAAAYQSVSGSIVNPPSSDFVLTFTKTDGTTSTATVAAGSTKYVTSLMPGAYTVSSSTGTLSTLSAQSFQVIASAVTKNLYYPETIPTATSKTVTVYPEQAVSGTNYHTIADAVAGIKAAGYSESTIILKSGATYEEQVRVDISGVTLTTDGDEKATISWYYGIGYTYYSLGSDGYYDKDRAMTKVGKLERDPDRWGAVVRVTGSNFTAENIIFENTFNQRATAAEIADGVVYNGCQSITVDRTASGFVADTRSATERAAAIAIEGKGVELYNCEFIGSQDTFFTGGTAYVKDCAITGNTDYIFGGGSIVFDNCDLIWGGYSDQAVGGYITASNGSDAGYLFRNCTIKDGNRQKAAGSFGRDWGGTNAHAYFINCTDATEKGVSGWSNMGGAVAAGTADLHVFDLANPTSYASYGTSDKYNITEFTFADATAKYEGAFDTIGFEPSYGTNAETTTKALDGVADTNDYVYGVLTTITAGSKVAVNGVTWTVKDANNNTYNFSTNDSVDGENMLSKGTFPTITGGGTATISMIFHAPQGDYEVASQAE